MSGKFQPPPNPGQRLLDAAGELSDPYRKWFELIPPALTSPASSGTVPTGPTSPGLVGQIACDGNYAYFCVAVNTWRRTPIGW